MTRQRNRVELSRTRRSVLIDGDERSISFARRRLSRRIPISSSSRFVSHVLPLCSHSTLTLSQRDVIGRRRGLPPRRFQLDPSPFPLPYSPWIFCPFYSPFRPFHPFRPFRSPVLSPSPVPSNVSSLLRNSCHIAFSRPTPLPYRLSSRFSSGIRAKPFLASSAPQSIPFR